MSPTNQKTFQPNRPTSIVARVKRQVVPPTCGLARSWLWIESTSSLSNSPTNSFTVCPRLTMSAKPYPEGTRKGSSEG